jgi:hypothetical protein
MRSVNNAVYDMLVDLNLVSSIDDQIEVDPENERRTLVKLVSKRDPSSMLEIEIIDVENDEPTVCVLNRVNMSYRVMTIIMDTLMDYLESAPTSVPQS